ncbi:MAG: benzoyl-CoA reductase subunit D [Planctomycetes bacterium]|nr:benzoyl-CoA reductase subunit D [Planctomycetota bacterium]
MIHTLGIDVGSSAIKAVAMKLDDQGGGGTLAASHVNKIRKRSVKDVVLQVVERVLQEGGLSREDITYIATTGEGEMVDFRNGHFYSMTSHARGALFLSSSVRAVMDVGALHARVMLMDSRSKVLDHRMTSQCASGSGQFLENISRYLGVAVEDIGRLSLEADKPEMVSSICAVLSETDVINMVSRGVSTPNILKGIHLSIGKRLINLLRMVKAEGDVLVTGGLAQDAGLLAVLQSLALELGLKVRIAAHPQSVLAGAIGAALWGGYRYTKLKMKEAEV